MSSRALPWLAAMALAYLIGPLAFSFVVSFTPSNSLETPFEIGRVSLRWYQAFFSDSHWTAGLWNSLRVASMVIPISLVGGSCAAYAFERYRFRGRSLLGTMIMAPLFVPPVVLGLALLALHQRIGLWGTPLSIAIGHSLWAIPIVFTVMRAALSQVDWNLEEAARGLGASPIIALLLITLPQVLPALLISVFFSFIVSVNELIMALFLATPSTQTLPTLIWPEVRYNVTPIVASASGVTTLLALALVLAANRLFSLRRLMAPLS